MKRSEKWAICFRQFSHANTDTNMYVESFQNRVKKNYLKRRFNRRVDDLLNLIHDIEQDNYWRHHLDVKYQRQGKTNQIETNRHKRGIQISDHDVDEVDDYKWKV